MERLLYEFPHGRPAYSPLVNEFEIAPRIDLWKNNKSIGGFYGLDMEYAISRKFILEAGISNIKADATPPAFIPESGLEIGAYYTIFNHSKYVITLGMEGLYQLENEKGNSNKYSIEPTILAAAAIGKLQIHLGLSSEISSSVKAGFFIAGIYHAGIIRPFIELDKPGEVANAFVITPGLVIPIYEELHLGIGIPITKSKAGITLFIAIEAGED